MEYLLQLPVAILASNNAGKTCVNMAQDWHHQETLEAIEQVVTDTCKFWRVGSGWEGCPMIRKLLGVYTHTHTHMFRSFGTEPRTFKRPKETRRWPA